MVESTVSEKLDNWTNFYEGLLGTTVLFDDLELPEPREGYDHLIVVLAGLTVEQVYQKCAELFPCWKYTDVSLDEVVLTNDRTPDDGTYAVWHRGCVEADEEHDARSARDLEQVGISGITLLERLLFEIKHFKETGKHLDIQNLTMCSGSRYLDGDVPSVDWRGNKLFVDCFAGYARCCGLRSREVVSSKTRGLHVTL